MPRGDRKGLKGKRPETFRGMGPGGGFAAGPGEACICPNCGAKTPYVLGTPCYLQRCLRCGTAMTQE